MNAPIWLIAEREFKAYAATFSFWVALAVGPLVMVGVLALAGLAATAPPPPTRVAIESDDAALRQSAGAALVEAARIDGKAVVVDISGASPERLRLSRDRQGDLDVRQTGALPLSPAARALLARTL